MVKLNISCYIWSSLNSVVWIMVKRLLHSLLPEYESFSSRLLWVPPSVSNGGSALMSWWFLKLQSLCILAMHLKSQSSLFQKWSFFCFSCGMDLIWISILIFESNQVRRFRTSHDREIWESSTDKVLLLLTFWSCCRVPIRRHSVLPEFSFKLWFDDLKKFASTERKQ